MLRYNWAYHKGIAQVRDTFEGLAYKDQVNIPLDEIEEQTLAICKEYNIAYTYALDEMCYTDIGVLYARHVNSKAFSSYNDYLGLSEEQQSKYVMDYGEARPYVYELVTPEEQKQNIEQQTEAQEKLRSMYRSGGRLNNDL